MNIHKKLENAVFKGLGLSPDFTIHSILRYAERVYKEDIDFERAKYRSLFNHQISDTKLYWALYHKDPSLIERIKDDLKYFTKGKIQSFEEDCITFVINNFKLITVY